MINNGGKRNAWLLINYLNEVELFMGLVQIDSDFVNFSSKTVETLEFLYRPMLITDTGYEVLTLGAADR